jgi:hypothetical protein
MYQGSTNTLACLSVCLSVRNGQKIEVDEWADVLNLSSYPFYPQISKAKFEQ